MPAPRPLVFAAWTDPELMARWLFPSPSWAADVISELRVGGHYRVAMRDPGGGTHEHFGEYREIQPVSRLVFTWTCPELRVENSLVTVELSDRAGATEISLTHELPDNEKIIEEHTEGWLGCLATLEKKLRIFTDEEKAMSSIKQEVQIRAALPNVYAALTRQAGFRGWWNKVAEVSEQEGGTVKLYFVKDGSPVNMTFRVEELKPDRAVRWSCTAHDMPSWVGTTLHWTLKSAGDTVLVAFEHSGWHGEAPEAVTQGWRHFMSSLKGYAETGTGQPW